MRLSEMIYTEEEMQELRNEIKRLSEKNKIYSNALVQEKENNKKLKENSLLGQATMEEAYARINELEEENKKLKTIIESIMKKYNMKEIGMGDEIIMKRDE